jgi:hypothetical protein
MADEHRTLLLLCWQRYGQQQQERERRLGQRERRQEQRERRQEQQ